MRPARGVLLIALIAALAALMVSPVGGASSRARSHAFRGPGIVLLYPGGLYVTNRPLDSFIDPAQRFVLSTYRVPNYRPNAGDNYSPPPTGVIAELMEDVPPPDPDFRAPPRPKRFALPELNEHMETFGARWGEIVFRDHDRGFYLFIGAGRRASSAEVALVLHTLDGLTVSVAPPSVTGA